MTTYYLYKTNGYNGILATDGKYACDLPIDSRGNDEMSGKNIYDDPISEFQAAYKQIDGLYNFDDIQRDFPSSIIDFIPEDFEEISEIITIE